ncbi:MAG: hypothetical protein IPJ76_16680 [Flavobacteriales bacterium]|nr:MAG: hypothetical protein IPJ76_16680 [Flavobacteriales bacterium]
MLKKILLGVLVTIVLLFGLLVWHIQAVTRKPAGHNDNMQLALIRFEAPLDSSEAIDLRSVVQGMPGVGHCYVNVAEGALSYSYDRGEQSAEQVFERVAGISNVACHAVTMSASDLEGTCPVIQKNSPTGQLSDWIAGWFN